MAKAKFDIIADDKTGKVFLDLDKRFQSFQKRSFAGLSFGQIGAGLSVGAVSKFAMSALKGADAVGNLSDATGLSMMTVQSFSRMLTDAGFSADAMLTTVNKLRTVQADAAAGNKTAQASFQALGISMEEISTLTPEKMLERVTRQLHQFGSVASVQVAATDIFGEKSAKMGQVLRNLGAQDFGTLNKAMLESGRIMSTDMVRAADTMEQAMTNAMNRISARRDSFMAKFMGGLMVLGDSIGGKTFAEASGDLFNIPTAKLTTPEERAMRREERAALSNPKGTDGLMPKEIKADKLKVSVLDVGRTEFLGGRDLVRFAQARLDDGRQQEAKKQTELLSAIASNTDPTKNPEPAIVGP